MCQGPEALRIPIDAYAMQLRPSEVEAVASGLGRSANASEPGSLEPIAAAVRGLPANDRAPLWELAVRHYGRRNPVDQAAHEIGMDTLHAHALLGAFGESLKAATGGSF
jgi:hypothetical protein